MFLQELVRNHSASFQWAAKNSINGLNEPFNACFVLFSVYLDKSFNVSMHEGCFWLRYQYISIKKTYNLVEKDKTISQGVTDIR